jgi:CRISPR-associated exonuclease Cas4
MPGEHMPSWSDDDLVLISALEHWSYCPRQCALIHVEQVWDENVYTLRGRIAHEKADVPDAETCDDVRIERAVPLWSDRLGLVGKADVVEFRDGVPFPVEYKHGPRRRWGHDDLQLCAQALCLEEMTGRAVPRGAVYHHGSRRRREVEFDAPLRGRVEEATAAVRRLLREGRLPPAVHDARCEHCSLRESCLPAVVAEPSRVRAARRALFTADDGPAAVGRTATEGE